MASTIDSRVPEIIDGYRKLCAYCGSVWNRAREAYPNEIACRKGCGICCELRSVNQIEAYAIRSYIASNKSLFGDRRIDDDNPNVDNDGVIADTKYVDTNYTDIDANDTPIDTDNADADAGVCPFLHLQSCSIYPVRPIICRTHGLILRSSEFPLSRQAASCPYNFPSVSPSDFPPELAVDVDIVTKNLARLNMAFCMAVGVDVKDVAGGAESRVPLRELSEKLFS